jgi:uncharacterized membrane protein
MSDIHKTFLGSVRTTFLRGVGLIIPLGLTYWFFVALLNAVDGIFSPLLVRWIGRQIPGLGFLAMLVIILLVGLLARNLIGRLFFSWFESLVQSIPFVRSVYGAVKDLVNAFNIGGKSKTFRQVVMIQYPRPGLYCVGFVTNEMSYTGPGRRTIEFLNVYIPNPPNPTSGFLALVPKREATTLNLSIEEGFKLVLSGGIVIPDRLTGRPAGPSGRRRRRGTSTSG